MNIDFNLIVGAVAGGLLAFSFQWLLKHLDYRNDFYKEIIKQRLAALEQMQKSLHPFMIKGFTKEGDTCHNIIGAGASEFFVAWSSLNETHEILAHWFTDEFNQSVFTLRTYLKEYSSIHKMKYNHTNGDYCIPKAVIAYPELNERTQKIYTALIAELRSLPDSRKFLGLLSVGTLYTLLTKRLKSRSKRLELN